MQRPIVKLNRAELDLADELAALWMTGAEPRFPYLDEAEQLRRNTEGARGQVAAAVYLSADPVRRPEGEHRRTSDLWYWAGGQGLPLPFPVEIKTTAHRWGGLAFQKLDLFACPAAFLVIAPPPVLSPPGPPCFAMAGWVDQQTYRLRAEFQREWRAPAFCLPQTSLAPAAVLRGLLLEIEGIGSTETRAFSIGEPPRAQDSARQGGGGG